MRRRELAFANKSEIAGYGIFEACLNISTAARMPMKPDGSGPFVIRRSVGPQPC